MVFSYSDRTPSRGGSWETAPAPVNEAAIAETVEADVAVIGAGFSGLAAAARCAQLGMSVVVVDKQTKSTAQGKYIGVLDSSLMGEKGISIDKKKFAKDWMKACGSRVNEDLLWLYMNRSGAALDWLLELAGDDVTAELYQGYYKGPGIAGYPGDHILYSKGGKYKSEGGALLIEILENAVSENGGVILRSIRATQLEKNEAGRVVSFVAEDGRGRHLRFIGKKAVVLAAGDCACDREMLAALCPVALKPESVVGCGAGDGQKLAYWAGAELDGIYWATSFANLAYGPYSFFFLSVNRDGKRFMNEDATDQAKAKRCLNQPGGDWAYAVADSRWIDQLEAALEITGGPSVCPESMPCGNLNRQALEAERDALLAEGKYLFAADTIEELAEKMGVPDDELTKTVARYNEMAAKGEDTDYTKRPELLSAIYKAPFYAFKWGPSLVNTLGGAVVDTDIRVQNPDDEPIPGLYATGLSSGGMYGVDYPPMLRGSEYGRSLTWALAMADSIKEGR